MRTGKNFITWTSERFIIDPDATDKQAYTNLSVNFTTKRRWSFRQPLYIRKIVCEMTSNDDYTVKLYINGNIAKTLSFTYSGTNYVASPLVGLKLTEGDLYYFKCQGTQSDNYAYFYIEGQYEVKDKLYYEGTTMYNSNNSSTASVFYLGSDNCCNAICSEDANATRIEGILLATSVPIQSGIITVYHHGAEYFLVSYSTSAGLEEQFIEFPDRYKFWMNPNYYHEEPQTEHFSITITDSFNQEAYASFRFLGYRRQLQGRYLFPYLYSFRDIQTLNLQNTSLNWVSASPQTYQISRFLKPKKYIAGKNGNDANVGGTLYKNNSLSYDNNGGLGTALLSSGQTYKEYKTDVVNADLNTDTYLRDGNTLSMRMKNSSTLTTSGYRLICETKL